jgi:hypothetical protein
VKHLVAVTVLAVAVSFLVVRSGEGSQVQGQSVYFGFLVGTPRIAAVAVDLAAPDANGQRALRAYVCDGLGPPEGMAVWFSAAVDPQAAAGEAPLSFTSVGGQERLVITALTERGVYGSYTDAQGATAHFSAYPAIDGAGIYEVTLDESLRYRGTSTAGATLDAQASTDGTTSGTITLPNGQQLAFTVHSLAIASPAQLALHGLPQDYLRYASVNQVPGEYTAVIAPGGSHWFGRSGSVRTARPGVFIIGLDKKDARPRLAPR